MFMKILGLLEIAVAIVVGLHLLYDMFAQNMVVFAIGYIFIRGIIFAISKDFASMVDLVFGTYAILALFGIFSHYIITIGLIIWFLQKGTFSLLGH